MLAERTAPGQFAAPTAVAVDGAGNLYVADTGNHRIQKLSLTLTGAPLAQWGTQGSAPSQFEVPFGVAVDRVGNLYVADTGNHRIEGFSPTGEPGTQRRESCMANDADGWARDARYSAIRRYAWWG